MAAIITPTCIVCHKGPTWNNWLLEKNRKSGIWIHQTCAKKYDLIEGVLN